MVAYAEEKIVHFKNPFFFFLRIFRVCKSDKITLEVFSSKCECLGSNLRRHEYREMFFLLFSDLGLFGLKLNKKEEVFFISFSSSALCE